MRVSNLELHGIDTPLEEEIILRAGPFEAIFEPSRAYLRSLRINGKNAVRNVYVHVRKPDWGTIVPAVTMLERHVDKESFQLKWKGVHRQGEINFEWEGTLTGDQHGIHYRCEGQALSSFKTNRTSLCVLLPREFRGCNADVEHRDGSKESIVMPVHVDPHQPLMGMRSVTIDPVRVTFEGDEFNAEDQRNWTDASFKAYPAGSSQATSSLKQGDRISQGARIEASGRAGIEPIARAPAFSSTSRVRIGATLANDYADLAGLKVDFIRVELPADSGQSQLVLDHARGANLPLQVVVQKGVAPPNLLPAEILIALNASIRPQNVKTVWLGAGPFETFNMGRHEARGFDGIEVSGTPQIHTFDESSILDNAETLPDLAESLEAILPNSSYGLNIQMLIGGPDPRLKSLFGALWILRNYIALSRFGTGYLTLGSVEELQYPAISALLKTIIDQPGKHEIRSQRGIDVLAIGDSCLILGNSTRRQKSIGSLPQVLSAYSLGPAGWLLVPSSSGQKLGPYEILMLNVDHAELADGNSRWYPNN